MIGLSFSLMISGAVFGFAYGAVSLAIPFVPDIDPLTATGIGFSLGLGASLIVSALAILAGGWAASRALARRPFAAAGACATLAAYGLIANVSFGAWQEWWNASMLLAGAVASAYATQALRDGR